VTLSVASVSGTDAEAIAGAWAAAGIGGFGAALGLLDAVGMMCLLSIATADRLSRAAKNDAWRDIV
jgi:hypothetical protein